MGNTIDSNPPPLVFCAQTLAHINFDELKPEFESAFRELYNLIDCMTEKPVDHDRMKILIVDCNQRFTRIYDQTKRDGDQLQSRLFQLEEECEKSSELEEEKKNVGLYFFLNLNNPINKVVNVLFKNKIGNVTELKAERDSIKKSLLRFLDLNNFAGYLYST